MTSGICCKTALLYLTYDVQRPTFRGVKNTV